MDCNESRRFLDVDADGELDLVHHLELTEHLRTCPECARRSQAARERRAALREFLPRFTVPASLAEKIRASLNAEKTKGQQPPLSSESRRPRTFWPIGNVAGLAASIAVALLVGYSWGGSRARNNFLLDEAITDHVRSLQGTHLTDVTSTDQHTVKPWFAGKIDFAPPVVDLATAGFPLIGGRLEDLDDHSVAALVFHRHQHTINLFVWPVSAATISTRSADRHGYHVETWNQNGFNFLAVSEIPTADLALFAQTFQASQPR